MLQRKSIFVGLVHIKNTIIKIVQTLKYEVMAKIKTEKQYKAACARIEELLKVVNNNTPADDKNFLELDLISDLVADYEEEYYPIESPSLVDVIKLRMYDMG